MTLFLTLVQLYQTRYQQRIAYRLAMVGSNGADQARGQT